MITTVAVCPHPPLMFRELAGQHDVAAGLRDAALSAVGCVARAAPDRIVLVGGAEESRGWDPGLRPQVRRFGGTAAREQAGLPLSLGVGRRLLDLAGWTGPVEPVSIAWDASAEQVRTLAASVADGAQPTALVVLGDGSARRGEHAPGHLDARAFGLDDEIGRALATGSADALLRIDPDLARELMVGGRSAFQVMAAAVQLEGGTPRPRVLYQDDPFGVMYHVVSWEIS